MKHLDMGEGIHEEEEEDTSFAAEPSVEPFLVVVFLSLRFVE